MTVALPPNLYKYRHINEHTESIFSKLELYFSKPAAFNDPFDCGFHVLCRGEENQKVIEATAVRSVQERYPDLSVEDTIDAARQVRKEIISNHMPSTEQLFHEKLAAETNHKVGILSLTERKDDILMWSHYADCHKGVCIEFRTDVEPSLFTKAKPVEYSEKYPILDLHEVVANSALRDLAPWMLTKSCRWEYEKEWRVLDFEAGPGVRNFPLACLSGVILGCCVSNEDKEKVLRWTSSLSSEIAIHQAKKSRNQFLLEIERIN